MECVCPYIGTEKECSINGVLCSELKKAVHVVVGLMGGLIEDITAFWNGEDADDYERKLCETYDIPYDRAERHDAESENQVISFVLEVK